MSEEANENEETQGQPEPSGHRPKPAMVQCPDCRGSGVIALLVTSRACTRCGGRGRIEPAAPEQTPEAARRPNPRRKERPAIGEAQAVSRTYDAQDRLTSETYDGGRVTTYFLSDAGPGRDDGPTDTNSDTEDSGE